MFILPYRVGYAPSRQPVVTYALVGINVLVYLITLLLDPGRQSLLAMEAGFVPEEWTRLHTLLTSMFLHGGVFHLVGNLYFLWLFGRAVEDAMGPLRFAALYLATGIFGSLLHSLTVSPFFADLPCIGASGAISGVLGAFAVLAPRARLDCFYVWIIFIRPLVGWVKLPAVVFLGVWFLIQVLYAASFRNMADTVPVAFWAHVGGFLFGALIVGGPGAVTGTGAFYRYLQRHSQLNKAFQCMRSHQWQDAARILERLQSEPHAGQDMGIALAWCYKGMGDAPTAAECSKQVLGRSASHKDSNAAINAFYILHNTREALQLSARAYCVLAQSFAARGKFAHAGDTYVRALEAYPEGAYTDGILFGLAEALDERRDSENARITREYLLERYPDSSFSKSVKWKLEADSVAGGKKTDG